MSWISPNHAEQCECECCVWLRDRVLNLAVVRPKAFAFRVRVRVNSHFPDHTKTHHIMPIIILMNCNANQVGCAMSIAKRHISQLFK